MDSTYALQIAIFEDSAADAALLGEHIEKNGIHAELETFESGEAFLRSFRAGRYDLVFLDIYTKDASGATVAEGIYIAEQIREADWYVTLAFTTVSSDHALESYRLRAPKYLEKPVRAEDVKEALELALLKRRSRASITLLIGGRHTDIPQDSIHFFEQKNHVVKVHTSFGVLQTSQTVRMDNIESRLPSPPFYRCHHSFIVNMAYMREMNRDFFYFVTHNGDHVLIRHGAAGKMYKAFEDYHLAATRDWGED